MDNIFMRYILNEATPPPTAAPPPNKQDSKMEIPGADKGIEPPAEPPDVTNPPPDTGGDPSASADMGGGDAAPSPNAGAEGDPSADPSMQGGEGDPSAQGADAGAGGAPPAGAGAPTVQSPEGQIDQDEKDTFSDLKPEQMAIKKAELRERYKSLYIIIVETIEKINKISHTTYDDTMLDFIVKKLSGMKSTIKDTLIDTFNTRTYVENKIELQRFIVVFNRLANMLTEIYKSRLKRQEVVMKQNNTKSRNKAPANFPIFARGYDAQ